MFGPILGDAVVTLAPVEPKHLENYCRWFSDPEVIRYTTIQAPPTLADEQAWFERIGRSEHDVVWGLFVDGEHIGSTGIHQIDWRNRRAQTGIIIGDRRWWGRSIATHAHVFRSRYAFEQLNLEKLVSTVVEGNAASRRALERVGYATVGVLRHHEFRNGHWHDTWMGELLREQWERTRTGFTSG